VIHTARESGLHFIAQTAFLHIEHERFQYIHTTCLRNEPRVAPAIILRREYSGKLEEMDGHPIPGHTTNSDTCLIVMFSLFGKRCVSRKATSERRQASIPADQLDEVLYFDGVPWHGRRSVPSGV
jgi:hypothetical protein